MTRILKLVPAPAEPLITIQLFNFFDLSPSMIFELSNLNMRFIFTNLIDMSYTILVKVY